MTMRFNGTELEEVRFNGVDCEKVYFNGELVFEKATTFVVTLTKLGGNTEAEGSVSPDHPIFGDIYWFGLLQMTTGQGGSMEYFMYMMCSNTSYTGRARVILGGVNRILTKLSQDTWRVQLTSTQWNAVPKTGTHPIIIEALD